MKSIKGFEQRLDNLSISSHGPRSDEDRAFLAKFTREEIDTMGDIFITHHVKGEGPLENLTPAEVDTLVEILDRAERRSPVSLPPINPNEPRCIACGEQPAYERDGSMPICDECLKAMIGHADESFEGDHLRQNLDD